MPRRITDLLRDRDTATRILDPTDPKFVTGSEQDRANARNEWHRQRFIHSVMSRNDLEEIPRSRLQPLRGPRLLEDTESGTFYQPRLDGLIDLNYVPGVVAYYVDASGLPVLLEQPHGGPKDRAEFERMQADREQRRNAPKPTPPWRNK